MLQRSTEHITSKAFSKPLSWVFLIKLAVSASVLDKEYLPLNIPSTLDCILLIALLAVIIAASNPFAVVVFTVNSAII